VVFLLFIPSQRTRPQGYVVELGQTSAAEGTGERTELITLERVLIFNIFFFLMGYAFFVCYDFVCTGSLGQR
jgi:hypothetical protein